MRRRRLTQRATSALILPSDDIIVPWSSNPRLGRILTDDVLAMIFTMVASEIAFDVYKKCRGVYMISATMGHDDELWKNMLWTPAIIAGVCKHWRYVCHGTPSVWAHMAIVFITGQNIRRSGQYNDLLDRLHYARDHPLHIYVCSVDTREGGGRRSGFFGAMRNVIWSNAARWRHLYLLQTYNGSDTFWPALQEVPRQLQSFHIVDPTPSTWDSFDMVGWNTVTRFALDIRASSFPEIDLSQLPSLTHVTLRFHPRRTFSIAMNIGEADLIHAISIISSCARLQFLRIELPDTAITRSTRTSILIPLSSIYASLLCLHTLHLIGYDPSGPSWSKILERMFLPALCHLIIDQPVPSRLGQMLKSWKCTLLSLSLTANPDDPFFRLSDDVVEAAQCITSLSIFTYSDHRTGVLVDQLCDPSVVPKLASLVLGLHHVARLSPLTLRSSVGFDRTASFINLLYHRSLSRLTAAVTCGSYFVVPFGKALNASLAYYYVWTFGESGENYILEKGKPLRYADTSSDYSFNMPSEHF